MRVFVFFCRDVWQAAGQQHLLEPSGTVPGAGRTQKVSWTSECLCDSSPETHSRILYPSPLVCVCLFFFHMHNCLFSAQHERSSCLRWHIRLHYDEHSRALHGLWRGVGPDWSLRRHLRLLVEPQGAQRPVTPQLLWEVLTCTHCLFFFKTFYGFYVCVGGQCILAVDVPGPSASEEQQGPLLSAALETQTPHPAQCRPDQGNIFPVKEVFTKQFSSVHCMLE